MCRSKWHFFCQALFYENIQSAHCQGIVKETMDAYRRQCKNINLLHLAEMLRITCFVAFWLKCRDLRVFPGTKCLLPGTSNYSAPLDIKYDDESVMHH